MLLPPLCELRLVVQRGTDRAIYIFAVGSPKEWWNLSKATSQKAIKTILVLGWIIMISIFPVFVVCQIMRLTLIWSATKSLALYVFFIIRMLNWTPKLSWWLRYAPPIWHVNFMSFLILCVATWFSSALQNGLPVTGRVCYLHSGNNCGRKFDSKWPC